MSRIGKIPIALPKEAKVNITPEAIALEGAKGKISLNIPRNLKVEQKDGKLFVTRSADARQDRANHGTFHAHIHNALVGVVKGHQRELQIQGVGFRCQVQGAKLLLNIGFSHPMEYEIPKAVKVTAPQPTAIVIEGLDKAMVGEVAAKIRAMKPPEPYKGKGIRYLNEVVKKKQGKSVTK